MLVLIYSMTAWRHGLRNPYLTLQTWPCDLTSGSSRDGWRYPGGQRVRQGARGVAGAVRPHRHAERRDLVLHSEHGEAARPVAPARRRALEDRRPGRRPHG